MRYARILSLLALITFTPALFARPAQRSEPPAFQRVARFVKRFVASVSSRITIPIGSPEERAPEEPAPAETAPNETAPNETAPPTP